MLFYHHFPILRSNHYSSSRFEKPPKFRPGFAATGRIVIGSQIGECGVKANQKLHLLHIYYIVIRSQLKCLIGAKALS
jgi:hypothetical protein